MLGGSNRYNLFLKSHIYYRDTIRLRFGMPPMIYQETGASPAIGYPSIESAQKAADLWIRNLCPPYLNFQLSSSTTRQLTALYSRPIQRYYQLQRTLTISSHYPELSAAIVCALQSRLQFKSLRSPPKTLPIIKRQSDPVTPYSGPPIQIESPNWHQKLWVCVSHILT